MKHIIARISRRRIARYAYTVLTLPFSILFILNSSRIHPAYRITFWRKLRLGLRFFRNSLRIQTGTSFKTHLAMELKLFEMPPDLRADSPSAAPGRAALPRTSRSPVNRRSEAEIFDSFEGLPEGDPLDREASGYARGDYAGSLSEVRANIERYGAPECCDYVQGWFNDHCRA